MSRPVRFGDFTLDADDIEAIEVQQLVQPLTELTTWQVVARTGPRTLVLLETFRWSDGEEAADEYARQVQRELADHKAARA